MKTLHHDANLTVTQQNDGSVSIVQGYNVVIGEHQTVVIISPEDWQSILKAQELLNEREINHP